MNEIAEFVSETYTFDRIELGPVEVKHERDGFTVRSTALSISGAPGWACAVRLAAALVPPALATSPAWLRAIDPMAARLVPGVRTAGSAGHGRREYYGVRRTRRIASARTVFRGVDLGGLTPLEPPVRFGFSSAPPTPQLVSVTTTIALP